MLLKNKLIMILLALLVVANITTISMYWLERKRPFPISLQSPKKQMGPPSEFLIRELALDSIQKAKYLDLVKIHQSQTSDLREKTKAAKDVFFDLIKQPVLNDSIAKNDVAQISALTAQQDLATLQHFRQVRALCNAPQQQKFDSIIHQMLGIMAEQRPNMPPPDGKQQPSDGRRPPPAGQRPPPLNGDGTLPPDGPPPERQNIP